MVKFLLFFKILIFGSLIAAPLFNDKIFRTKTIANCSDSNTTTKYKGHFIGTPSPLVPNNKWVIDGSVNFHDSVNPELDLAIDASRCSPINQRDCESYPRFVVSDICGKLTATGAFYSKLLDSISPRLQCPLKKGTYVFANATLDLEIVKAMPLQGYKWRAVVSLVEKKTKTAVICADIVLDIEDFKRKRRRKPSVEKRIN